jgi:hypothetical protein
LEIVMPSESRLTEMYASAGSEGSELCINCPSLHVDGQFVVDIWATFTGDLFMGVFEKE